MLTRLGISHLLGKHRAVLLVVTAVLAVSLSIYSYQHYNSTANKILEIATNDITSNARIQANDLSLILENGLDSIITNLQVLSSSPALRNYDNDSLSLLDAVQKSTNELPDFYMWLDKDGRLIWISGMNDTSYDSLRGLDLSHNQYFSVPRYTLAPYYSHGQIRSIDDNPRLYMSYPIIDKSTASTELFKGAVVAAISFNVTNNILKKQTSSSSEIARNSILLLDKSGEVLLYSEDSNENLPSRNIFESEIELLGMEEEESSLINSFLKRSVNEPLSEPRDLVLDEGRNTIVSNPIFVNDQHFWTVFVVAPHHLASDVIALFNQQNNISLFVIIMILAVSSGIALMIMLWNRRLASLVNMKTGQLQLKSEELNRANNSLRESNKQISFVNQQLLLSNKQLSEANKKLENHDRLQKEFINIAAHELRTPIMPILGGVELMNDKLDNETKEIIKEDVFMIVRNAERLHKLAEDILQATIIEAGNFKLDIQKTNLNSLISATIEDVERKYSHEKNIPIVMKTPLEQQEQQLNYKGKVELHSSQTDRSIFCDPQKISQVLFNILDNALKFTNKGQVIVTISENSKAMEESAASQDKKSEEVLVSIKDTGTGVDPSIKDRLFQRFATQSVKGTGLGLYLSKKIIEAHGGRIWARSNNDGGQGSTFTFSLPVAGPG
jgi:signal transduction histidine kinase